MNLAVNPFYVKEVTLLLVQYDQQLLSKVQLNLQNNGIFTQFFCHFLYLDISEIL